ncbi:hypothetical protein [uncultured Kordia sp.]|uniref:hypothetical protein n=1 Tax=uncultured Kordia sp. TaxID=507699 RepID=UPI00261F1990|nr:hypothetical protein [uncultured Kordia sp.]
MNNQIELCKVCANRKFSSSQGIVCGLTDQKPAFINNCPDYEKDVKEEERQAKQKMELIEATAHEEEGKPMSVLNIVVSVIIFIVAMIRLATSCS